MDQIRDKKAFHQSSITTFRERPPTSPDIANRGLPLMVQDFSRQQRVVPNSLGSHAGMNPPNHVRTMNATGRPMALDTMVGGAPDVRARLPTGGRQKLIPTKGK